MRYNKNDKKVKEYLRKTNQIVEKPPIKHICYRCGKEINDVLGKGITEFDDKYYFYYHLECYKELYVEGI